MRHLYLEPAATMTQAINAIMLPLLIGVVFWRMDLSMQSMYDRVSAIALMMVCVAYFSFDIVNLFPNERDIFDRENTAGMYRPISFFVGRTMAEVPQHLVFILIMGSIVYTICGLQNDAEKYFIFMLIAESMVVASAGLLMIFSAYAKNREQANLFMNCVVLLFMLFDGNWVSLDKVPVYCRWIEYISCLSYASQAAIANEYRGITFTCSQHEIDLGLCPNESGSIPGEDVLYNRGLDDVDVYYNIMMLWVLALGYRMVAFVAVWLLYRSVSPRQIIKNTFGL